jgi:hypothetical protein
MPASLVVQLALWPDEVAHWARDEKLSESLVYNMLAARKPYARTRARLADRLGVSVAILDHLVESRRPQPTALRGADAALAAWGPAPSAGRADSPPPPTEDPAAWPPIDWSVAPYPRYRDGTNPIERRAVRCLEADVASMPAATVVGLAIWPETLAEWSRRERLKSSVVWATLSGSPSAPVRDALARRLGVSLRDLDALVTTARRAPVARRPWPAPLADAGPAIAPPALAPAGGAAPVVTTPRSGRSDAGPAAEPAPSSDDDAEPPRSREPAAPERDPTQLDFGF